MPFFGLLGLVLDLFRPILGCLGPFSAFLGLVLGLFLAIRGHFLGLLGWFWAYLGQFKAVKGHFRPFWAGFGPISGCLGPCLVFLGWSMKNVICEKGSTFPLKMCYWL